MRNRFYIARIMGWFLLSLGLGILLTQQIVIRHSIRSNEKALAEIRQMLPDGMTGSPADYSVPEMPILQFDGVDYLCLLEVPTLGVELPIRSGWDPGIFATQPARFWGSIYDGSLILGGDSHPEQFGFCSRLDVGDPITLRDMQGTSFRCRVETILRSSSADFEKLSDSKYPLTLFVRERYESRYIIVRCVWDY